MKLLLVFVSALVLVHGNVNPSEGQDSAYEIKPEAEAGYAAFAGQEAGGEAPQALDAEEAPEARVFGAEEEPRAYEAAEPLAEQVPASESGIYLSSVARVCTTSWCKHVCWQLGYKNGQCISLDTCWCHN